MASRNRSNSLDNRSGSKNRPGGSSFSVVNLKTNDESFQPPALRRAHSLPSMGDHEAEVLYNRMRGIKSILKYSVFVHDNSSMCSTIATSRSAKESMGKSNTRRANNMRKGTIIEGDNDDDPNYIDSDDDLDNDGVFANRSIEFHHVEIREYARTVGDNPSCSSGAPIT
jgi:hypothetical protein